MPVCVTRRTVLQKVRRCTCCCTQFSCLLYSLLSHSQPSFLRLFHVVRSRSYLALFRLKCVRSCKQAHTFSLKRTLYSNIMLRQFVNTGFQVLFHSPPGVLFTFPSQYYALSVTKEYLALRGGPRSFHQGFSCLNVLWILLPLLSFRVRGFHPLSPVFPVPFH